jgi:hypothetical protein
MNDEATSQLAGSSPAMRTMFPEEIEGASASDTVWTQESPESSSSKVRFPKRIKYRGLVLVTIYGKSKGYLIVTVKMPDQVARQWGETPDAVGRHEMEDAAIEGYRAGLLSHRQVGEMLGLDYWQTETFLKERGRAGELLRCGPGG